MSDTALEKQRALKQAEQVLKESERLFRAVWEYASDAMAISTSDGIVFAANPAYFHLYGFPQEEVVGKHFSIIFPEEQQGARRMLRAAAFTYWVALFGALLTLLYYASLVFGNHRLLVPFAEPMAPSASLNPVITLFHTTAKE